jgi:hypothetical protein
MTVLEHEYELEQELPERPRRKLVTPVRAALAAGLIAAAGFIGGVEVQKAQGGSSSSGARAGFPGGGASGAPPAGFGGQQQSNATVGSVKSKDGKTLYVTDSNGNTIKVETTSNSKITRSATASSGAIHPGDSVVIQGSKSSSGVVTATQITATASQ